MSIKHTKTKVQYSTPNIAPAAVCHGRITNSKVYVLLH